MSIHLNTAVKFPLVIVTLIVVALLAAPAGLYMYGLNAVPEDRSPVPPDNVAANASQAYWRYLGGAGEADIRKRNPYGLTWEFLQVIRDKDGRSIASAEHKLTELASRALLLRQSTKDRRSELGNGNLAGAAAFVWVSRNWSGDEAISTLLSTSYFGHGFQGLDQASEGYFGMPSKSLNELQMYVLFVTAKSPNSLDPWCNMDRLAQFFTRSGLLESVSITSSSINLRPAPSKACAD